LISILCLVLDSTFYTSNLLTEPHMVRKLFKAVNIIIYMNIFVLLSILSISISVFGIIIAVASFLKQENLEKRIKKKEEFKEIAKELENFENKINFLNDILNNPFKDEDLCDQLKFLAKDIIAYKHDTGRNSTIIINPRVEDRSSNGESTVKKVIENDEQWVDLLGKDDIYISTDMWRKEETGMSYGFDLPYYMGVCFHLLKEIKKHEEILNEFKPEFTQKLEDCIERIAYKIFSSIIEKNKLSIDPDKFNTVDDMIREIYFILINYNNLRPLLDELKEIIGDIEQVRRDLLRTSYS